MKSTMDGEARKQAAKMMTLSMNGQPSNSLRK
jgi:hypothetical protein